jgi:hypothetical protein
MEQIVHHIAFCFVFLNTIFRFTSQRLGSNSDRLQDIYDGGSAASTNFSLVSKMYQEVNLPMSITYDEDRPV